MLDAMNAVRAYMHITPPAGRANRLRYAERVAAHFDDLRPIRDACPDARFGFDRLEQVTLALIEELRA